MGYFVKNRNAHRSPNGIVIPSGTTANRPLAPAIGTMRYNSEYYQLEYWNGAQYMLVGTQTEFSVLRHSVIADGINTIFDISFDVLKPAFLLVFLDGVYQSYGVNYTVTGNIITFPELLPAGTEIIIVYPDLVTSTVPEYTSSNVDSLIYYPQEISTVPLTVIDMGFYDPGAPVDLNGVLYDSGNYVGQVNLTGLTYFPQEVNTTPITTIDVGIYYPVGPVDPNGATYDASSYVGVSSSQTVSGLVYYPQEASTAPLTVIDMGFYDPGAPVDPNGITYDASLYIGGNIDITGLTYFPQEVNTTPITTIDVGIYYPVGPVDPNGITYDGGVI